jgi:hypothetical protein
MDVFTFVIIVVIIACGSGVVNNYLKNQRERTLMSGEEDEAVYQELAVLRERIEVLEKIVTDEKYQLERDLNRLERQA